jgi:23S rRNA-/tRNA-specific pseudouridylate synthase
MRKPGVILAKKNGKGRGSDAVVAGGSRGFGTNNNVEAKTTTTNSSSTHKTVASKTLSRSEIFRDVMAMEETEETRTVARITDVLMRLFPERFPTKTAAKKAIRRGEVRVNEEKADVGFELKREKGDGEGGEGTAAASNPDEDIFTIEIRARMNASADVASRMRLSLDDVPKEIREGDNATTVAYEDEECVVVRKSFGIPTLKTKTSGNVASSKSSNNNNDNSNDDVDDRNSELAGWNLDRVLPYIVRPAENVEGALHRPRPVHRLDSLTGGLVVCAKTRRALKTLSEAFRDRTARKRYRAVLVEYANVKGGVGKRKINEKRGTITSNDMGPKSDQYAETEFTICDEKSGADDDKNGITRVLVDFHPKTGRTHQLRKHAEKQLNMPILGDDRYGGKTHCDNAKKYRPKLHLFAAEVTLPPEAVPWRNDAREEGGGGGGEPLNVRVSEPAFFRKSMDASDVWSASTFAAAASADE